MFDEIIRELKKLEQPRRIEISIPLDERGFLDRSCPHSECLGTFKVHFEDWRDKVRDDEAFCPFCRHACLAEQMNTEAQQKYIECVAEREIAKLVNDAFGRAAKRTPQRKISGGLIDLTMSLSYKPGRIPTVLPASACEELRQEFTCEKCQCRFASLGASFFCPACGHNSATSSFDNTLTTVRKAVGAITILRQTLGKELDADTAADATRQLLEDQLPRLVGAFERLSEALFAACPTAPGVKLKGNVFQRIDDGSTVWRDATGRGYEAFLNASQLDRLRLLYQRRHVISHRQGIVDQSYLDKSGDLNYAIGQRLKVRDSDVSDLADILEDLASGLRTLV